MQSNSRKDLLKKIGYGFLTALVLTVLSYFFFDRSLSSWIYANKISSFSFLEIFADLSKFLLAAASLTLIYIGIKGLWKKKHPIEHKFLILSLSTILSIAIADTLKFFFGRYWPCTWINDNPSWIADGAYGFHPFHYGGAYCSFPSGHMAIAVAFATALWLNFPKWRLFSCLVILIEAVGLVGKNYHFLGDLFGGAFVGFTVAQFIHLFFSRKQLTR